MLARCNYRNKSVGNIAETCKPSDEIFHRCGNEDGVSITNPAPGRGGEKKKERKKKWVSDLSQLLSDKFVVGRRAKARRGVKFSSRLAARLSR